MWLIYYIMPGIPPPPIGGIGAGLSSLMSTNAHSVVNIIPATDAAFSRATLVTFLGSIIPSFNISTYLPSFALYPKFLSPSRTFDTTTDPSPPEFSTGELCLRYGSQAVREIRFGQTARRASRRALRRTLPASSRTGSDTNSKLLGIL